jgi:hypothetical protein
MCIHVCVLVVFNERNTNSYPRPGLQTVPAFQVEPVERVGGAVDPEMVRWHGMVGADARCGRHSESRIAGQKNGAYGKSPFLRFLRGYKLKIEGEQRVLDRRKVPRRNIQV